MSIRHHQFRTKLHDDHRDFPSNLGECDGFGWGWLAALNGHRTNPGFDYHRYGSADTKVSANDFAESRLDQSCREEWLVIVHTVKSQATSPK